MQFRAISVECMDAKQYCMDRRKDRGADMTSGGPAKAKWRGPGLVHAHLDNPQARIRCRTNSSTH